MPDKNDDATIRFRGSSGEKMPDREWVRSNRRAESPGIRKEEDEVRLD